MGFLRRFVSFIGLTAVIPFIVTACNNSGGVGIASYYNEWTWISGNNSVDQTGNYGSLGVAAPTNVPGAREEAVSWIDTRGNLWLFGGGYILPGGGLGVDMVFYNDLWKFDGAQWTWISGSNIGDQPGNYGVLGVAAPTNVPGARQGAVSWTDTNGNLWLFGGLGYGVDIAGSLNDLWKFDGKQWTWVSGSDTANEAGNYGVMGVAADTNVPGAREYAVGWTDTSGNLWLFGGKGYDSTGSFNYLNDLWEYDGAQWTWISGSNTGDELGNYGVIGKASNTNVPGARDDAVSWTDAGGNLWLFGGYGTVASATEDVLNDLWKFDGSQWTWVTGSQSGGQAGIYGNLGVAASTNTPGARGAAVSWTDPYGNFWLFGGGGVDSAGRSDYLNDLWKYDGVRWTWVSGSDTGGQPGNYGILGISAPDNMPGARLSSVSWTDADGNLLMFGGSSYAFGFVYHNDLWRYQP